MHNPLALGSEVDKQVKDVEEEPKVPTEIEDTVEEEDDDEFDDDDEEDDEDDEDVPVVE